MIPGEKFDKEYFASGVYKDYQALLDSWVGKVAERIYRRLKDKPAAKVLDVGCGFGTLLVELQSKYHFEVAGVEYSPYAIKKAPVSVRNKIKRGSILKIPFKRDSFDAVACFDVINYLKSKEIARGIKNLVDASKGYIFFSSIYRGSFESSQKHNPDPLRTTILLKKEYINLFAKYGAKLVEHFYSPNSEDILVFEKIRARNRV